MSVCQEEHGIRVWYWCAIVEEAQHHRELVSKMLKKMSQREVLGAFTKWKEATDQAHNARAAASAIGFFFTSATRDAFIAFQRNVVYEKTMRKAAQFFIGGSKAVPQTLEGKRGRDCVRSDS